MPSRDTFVRSLVTERDAFARFLGLLEAESASLIKGDVEELVRLARIKSEQVDALNGLARDRSRFLSGEGFKPDRIGMSEWLVVNGGPDGERLSRLWQSLVHDASEARRMNEKNGVLIDSRLRFNQAALNALRGASHTATLYGPDGAPEFRGRQRDLGHA